MSTNHTGSDVKLFKMKGSEKLGGTSSAAVAHYNSFTYFNILPFSLCRAMSHIYFKHKVIYKKHCSSEKTVLH